MPPVLVTRLLCWSHADRWEPSSAPEAREEPAPGRCWADVCSEGPSHSSSPLCHHQTLWTHHHPSQAHSIQPFILSLTTVSVLQNQDGGQLLKACPTVLQMLTCPVAVRTPHDHPQAPCSFSCLRAADYLCVPRACGSAQQGASPPCKNLPNNPGYCTNTIWVTWKRYISDKLLSPAFSQIPRPSWYSLRPKRMHPPFH